MWKTSDKVEFNGDNTPYSAAGRYYLRTADEDREVTPEELKNFFVSNEYKEKWERAASSSIIKQGDRTAVKSFGRKAVLEGRMPKGTRKFLVEDYDRIMKDIKHNEMIFFAKFTRIIMKEVSSCRQRKYYVTLLEVSLCLV